MNYLGFVTRVANGKIYVTIPELGGNSEFGALLMVIPRDPIIDANTAALATDSGGSTPHTHTIPSHTHATTDNFYSKGDKVVIVQIGVIKDNLIVIGRI